MSWSVCWLFNSLRFCTIERNKYKERASAAMKVLLIFGLMSLLRIISFEVFAEKIMTKIRDRGKTKREEIILKNFNDPESNSLLGLLRYVGEQYLQDCSTTVILYDDLFESSRPGLLKDLFKNVPFSYVKKRVNAGSMTLNDSKTFFNKLAEINCWNYIIFIEHLSKIGNVIDRQSVRKVIAVSGASSWTVFDFLKGPIARLYTNLLVIAPSTSRTSEEGSFLLYTHNLYSDGIGSSRAVILTSWIQDGLTRPKTVLFPKKLTGGFNGHRFRVAATHKPPFTIRRVVPATDQILWDGIDIRLITLLSKVLNFTIDVREPDAETVRFGEKVEAPIVFDWEPVEVDQSRRSASARPLLFPDQWLVNLNSLPFENYDSSVKAITREVSSGKASMALGGLYRTVDLMTRFDTTPAHTYDCASFISRTSTALPRYRAVLGPFRPSVWVTLTFAYLGAIIPLTLSSKNSLLSLLTRPKELNEMFWFVFSTFTNCFTIRSPLVYEGLGKNATGILMGLYWVFTIIVTSCYTSSIIAFITIPVYPTAMDTSNQLLYYRYRIGTLDRDGWESYFKDDDDPQILKLFRNLELVPTVGEGVKNASRAYFWPYAFLGSKAMLEYIVQADFTPSWKTKRSLMHISRECFVQFGVTVAFPKGSVYTQTLGKVSQRAYQTGLLQKITSDVKWDVQRSSSGKLLQVSSDGTLYIPSAEERQLTLDDIQGMFMVLGAGVLIALLVLILECGYRCIRKWCYDVQNFEHHSEARRVRRSSSCYPTYWNYFDDYEAPNALMRKFRSSI